MTQSLKAMLSHATDSIMFEAGDERRWLQSHEGKRFLVKGKILSVGRFRFKHGSQLGFQLAGCPPIEGRELNGHGFSTDQDAVDVFTRFFNLR